MAKKLSDPEGKNVAATRFTSETAKKAAKKSAESRKTKKTQIDALLAEAGIENPTETERALAHNAVHGSSADMRLFLQQTNQLIHQEKEWDGEGECPTCGLDPSGGLVLDGETIASIDKAIALLTDPT